MCLIMSPKYSARNFLLKWRKSWYSVPQGRRIWVQGASQPRWVHAPEGGCKSSLAAPPAAEEETRLFSGAARHPRVPFLLPLWLCRPELHFAKKSTVHQSLGEPWDTGWRDRSPWSGARHVTPWTSGSSMAKWENWPLYDLIWCSRILPVKLQSISVRT